MEQSLKQRLVGAVVITSLAAIFVPMLFDDPIDESGRMISELKIPDAPDSSLNSGSTSLPKTIDDVINLPLPSRLRKDGGKHQAVSEMVRWFIQVGSFDQESNAVLLKNKVKKQGFPVTINKVTTKKGFSYKVNVGPELDKNRAESMKVKIDKLNNIKSFLTSINE